MIVRGLLLSLMLAAPAPGQEMTQGSTVVLRGLDRIAGEAREIRIAAGQEADFGRLRIGLRECRYPADNPAADAFAFLEIADTRLGATLFAGWMIASAPALNALDHVRYDVWVIGCQ
jgi:hypothetical protein